MKNGIEKELAAIYAKQKILRTDDVIKYAKNPRTALHRCFEWNDGKAADAYRRWQARELIVDFEIEISQTDKPVQTYISLISDRNKRGGGYRMLVDVLKRDDLRAELLEQALQEMKLFQRKYRHFKELASVFHSIDKVLFGQEKKKKKKVG